MSTEGLHPLPPDEGHPRTLLEAVNRLTDHVKALTEVSTINAKAVGRLRLLTLSMISLVLLGGTVMGYLIFQTHQNVQSNTKNAVQACENANNQRSANLALWNFLLDASERKNDSPAQTAQLEQIRTYVTTLFSAHDCNNLGHHYVVPDPPSLTPKG